MNRPVLVLGGAPRVAVAIARSLERHRVPVDVAAFRDEDQPVIASRAVQSFRRVPVTRDLAGDAAPFFVRRTVRVDGIPETRGAIRGSMPVDSAYCPFQYLNWACLSST
jgi:hypothetical protein